MLLKESQRCLLRQAMQRCAVGTEYVFCCSYKTDVCCGDIQDRCLLPKRDMQMAAAETGRSFVAETKKKSPREIGLCLLTILTTCLLSTRVLSPIAADEIVSRRAYNSLPLGLHSPIPSLLH